MESDLIKTLELSKQIATIGIFLGVVVFFISLFVSDYNPNYTMSVSGIGIVIASMVFFGFGMFLCLADEISTKNERLKI